MSKTTFAQGQLRALIERIERLEEEKANIAGDIREVYSEAKANGFDTKIIRMVVSLRKKDANERQEQEALLDVYLAALGMQPSLFDAEEAQSQPPAAPQTVERSGGLDALTGGPAAPIQEQAPERVSTGVGKPLTDETEERVARDARDALDVLTRNSSELAQSQIPPSVPPNDPPAGQVAGALPPVDVPATDSTDMTIPAFLRRGKEVEARA